MSAVIAAVISGFVALVSGIISGVVSHVNNVEAQGTTQIEAEKDRELTQQLNEQNRQYELEDTARLEQREDTAIQRRMADLKEAGINPLLAGSQGGAQSGTITARNTALQPSSIASALGNIISNNKIPDIIQNTGINLAQSTNAIINREKTIAEIEKIKAETEGKRKDTVETEMEIMRKKIENEYIKEKIQKELKGLELNNKNLEQTGKNLMAEYGYRFNQEEREKAMHDIEKINKQTERALNQARTWNEQSETALTDQEKAIRKEEFRLKKEQIEKGYLLEMMRIFGDTAGKMKFKGK